MTEASKIMNPKIEALLRIVREMIRDPAHFTHSWFAKNAEGVSVSWDDPTATRWDLIGAVCLITQQTGEVDRESVLAELKALLPKGYDRLYQFSEAAGHGRVLELLDRAINPPMPEPVEDAVAMPEAPTKKKRGRPAKNKTV